MKATLTALLTTVSAMALSLALSLALAPAALAHGGAADGHADPGGPLGALLLPPEFVLGGVALLGALYALKRRGG